MIILIYLFAAHWICDYPLQGEYLAKGKQSGEMRFYHLAAHSGIHAGAVALITGSASLAVAEFIAHFCIDEMKTRGKISYSADQSLHLICKIVWFLIAIS